MRAVDGEGDASRLAAALEDLLQHGSPIPHPTTGEPVPHQSDPGAAMEALATHHLKRGGEFSRCAHGTYTEYPCVSCDEKAGEFKPSKEWCEKALKEEGDHDISAGPEIYPIHDPKAGEGKT